MKKLLISSFLCVTCGFLPLFATAAPAKTTQQYQAGKQYKILNKATAPTVASNKIVVLEFFSYGCPWCYHLEPTLEKWEKTKPENVDFERVPVVFHPNWKNLARAYYALKALGVAEKISPTLFTAVQKQQLNFDNDQDLANFVAKQGIDKQKFLDAYAPSPGMDAQMANAANLMRRYKITQIPTIVVGDKYVTNTSMVNGDDQQLIQVVDYLIKKITKEQQGENKQASRQ